MWKPTMVLAAFALTALGAPRAQRPNLLFKEEVMTIEYTVTEGEAAIVLEAETERSVDYLEVRSPRGDVVLEMRGPGGGPLALSGFVLESRETTPQELFDIYPEGNYSLRARSMRGRAVLGRAKFSHSLPAAPQILYPQEGAINVPTTKLQVRWAAHPTAKRYRVIMEQGDNDGLSVELPADATSLLVPDGVLRSGTDTLLEIGAVGDNGNCTLVEVSFATL